MTRSSWSVLVPDGYEEMSDDEKSFHGGPWITTKKGINRFVWDLRHEGAVKVLGNKLGGEANQGPLVVPGEYVVELNYEGADGVAHSIERSFEVVNDPRPRVSLEALEEQLEALLGIRDHISAAHKTVTKIRSIKEQLGHWLGRDDVGEEVRSAAQALTQRLHEVEDRLMVPGEHTDTFGLNEPSRLSEKLASVISIIASADSRPTRNSLQVADKYSKEIDEQLEVFNNVVDGDLAEFNEMMASAALPAIRA